MTLRVSIILLAAGASTRMRGSDKLLAEIDGISMLRHCALRALGSEAQTIVVLAPEKTLRQQTLAGLNLQIVLSPDWQEGMAASIRAGMAAIAPETDAVIVALADMPTITRAHYSALIAAYAPESGREICRAQTQGGTPGHPVLFGRRFFRKLGQLVGDAGGREILREYSQYLVDVATAGEAAACDIDTPEDLAKWRCASLPFSK